MKSQNFSDHQLIPEIGGTLEQTQEEGQPQETATEPVEQKANGYSFAEGAGMRSQSLALADVASPDEEETCQNVGLVTYLPFCASRVCQ